MCSLLLAANASMVWAEDATAPGASADNPQASAQTAPMTAEQIDSLVAPIALYPDPLISQILVASTYPLEIVQAYQWIQQHPDLKGQELTTEAQKQNWDPSVQALVAFPDVLKRMNQDVTWTTNLGNAFLANQSQVMDEVQNMRQKAQNAGKLSSTDKQTVETKTDNGKQVIVIEPVHPDVVYVPDYDPVWIWGPAPVYYPYPYWYYPPPPSFGWCWWGPGIAVGAIFIGWHGWGGWGWGCHWYSHTVVVNNTFFVENHFHSPRFIREGGRDVWSHDSFHRMGVAYPNRAVGEHFHRDWDGRTGAPFLRPRPTVGQVQNQLHSRGGRFQGGFGGERFGNRQINPSVYNHSRSAFGGVEPGSAARMHSNRGFSSLGHAQGAANSPRGTGGGRWGGERGGNWGGRGGDGGGHGGGWAGGGGNGGGGGHWGGGR